MAPTAERRREDKAGWSVQSSEINKFSPRISHHSCCKIPCMRAFSYQGTNALFWCLCIRRAFIFLIPCFVLQVLPEQRLCGKGHLISHSCMLHLMLVHLTSQQYSGTGGNVLWTGGKTWRGTRYTAAYARKPPESLCGYQTTSVRIYSKCFLLSDHPDKQASPNKVSKFKCKMSVLTPQLRSHIL